MKDTTVGVALFAVVMVGGLAAFRGGGEPALPPAPAPAATTPATPTPGTDIACDVDARCLAANHFDPHAGQSDAEREQLWGDRCCRFQFLVALVPDPVDSHAGWQFDPFVEAIERAVEAAGYALDRFRLPWGAGATARTQCAGSAPTAANAPAGKPSSACAATLVHEREPGVLVFRRGKDGGNAPSAHCNAREDAAALETAAPLLVVFLVGETPTGGIQKQALLRALDRVGECRDDSIAILGPSYSGSARSLVTALQQWWLNHPDWMARNAVWRTGLEEANKKSVEGCDTATDPQTREWCESAVAKAAHRISPFRIMSGAATSFPTDELHRIGRTWDGVDVAQFGATVIPDSTALKQFIDAYLGKRLHVDRNQIALLIEANTTYGQALGSAGRLSPAANTADAASDVVEFPFPMHIAGVRGAADKAQAAPTPGVPNAVRPLLNVTLEDGRDPPDLIPQMFPGMTGPSVELVLANILATISRKQITYVGVLASDTRDKLFLAQQIRKYCPGVRIFTLESDLLYAHPSYRAGLEGMLVASTYPLFSRTQAWTGLTFGKRFQFPSSTTQGVYNATLALLGNGTEYLMIDYAALDLSRGNQSSVAGKRQPPLWISVVGNGGVWPVAEYRVEDPYVYTQWQSWKEAEAKEDETGTVRSALILWLALTVFAMIQAACYLIAYAGWYAAARAVPAQPVGSGLAFFPRTKRPREQQAYTILCFATLLLLYAFVSGFFFLKPVAIGELGQAAIVGIVALLIAVLLDASLFTLASRSRGMAIAALRLGVFITVLAVAVHLLRLLEPIAFMTRLPFYSDLDGTARFTQFMLDYERVLNLESDLSPLLPATFVALIWYLWGYIQLRRLRLMERAQVPNPLAKAERLVGAGFKPAQARIADAIAHPLTFPAWLAGGIWIVPCIALRAAFLPTFEGDVFDRIFEIGFFMASVGIIVTGAQVYGVWSEARWVLNRMSVHPIAAALAALPERLSRRVRESYYAYIPSLEDQVFVLRLCERLPQQFRVPLRSPGGESDGDLESAESALTAALRSDGDKPNATAQQYFSALADQLVTALENPWASGLPVRKPATAGEKGAGESPPNPAADWLLNAEDIVATQVVTYIGQVFAHVRNLLMFVTAGLVLLLLSVPAYPFQPQRLLNMFTWVQVLGVVSVAMIVSVQMNRSETLSHITGSGPNQLTFNRTFMRELLFYGAVPLLGLIATQFPAIGGSLFFWLEPALRALK